VFGLPDPGNTVSLGIEPVVHGATVPRRQGADKLWLLPPLYRTEGKQTDPAVASDAAGHTAGALLPCI
jgi:hypothetical protein